MTKRWHQRRNVQLAVGVWLALNAFVLLFARGDLSLDRPSEEEHHRLTGVDQLLGANVVLFELLAMSALVYWLTRRRPKPAIASHLSANSRVLRETLWILGYGVAAQVGGVLLGLAMGWHPISFHLTGTVFGTHDVISRGEVLGWAIYNLVAYAVLPYLWFRRNYSNKQLLLVSNDRRRDALLIMAVLGLEFLFQFALVGSAIAGLSATELVAGVPLSFVLYLAGTVLPTLIFVQAILVPRFLRLTGSTFTTIVLGGLTYAALHFVEGWSNFSTPGDVLISVVFLLLLYVAPGAFKTLLTVRTGNAWVHAWAYHAVTPHVVADTPLIAKIFRL